MKVQRLFEIVYLLLLKQQFTANELAQHFEVSKRTILRDIETLATAGIPIYATRGRNGGIRLVDSFVLNKRLLTHEEQEKIVSGLQTLAFFDQGVLAKKLQAFFQTTSPEWLEVDFTRWGADQHEKVKFTELRHAILTSKRIQFTYIDAYGYASARRAYPLKVTFKQNDWYLQAFCLKRQAYRTFRLRRVNQLTVDSVTFDAQQYACPELDAAVLPQSPLVAIHLQFQPVVSYRVYEEFAESTIFPQTDNSLIVQITCPQDAWLESFLLSFGPNVKILQPASLKERLRVLSQQTWANYLGTDEKNN